MIDRRAGQNFIFLIDYIQRDTTFLFLFPELLWGICYTYLYWKNFFVCLNAYPFAVICILLIFSWLWKWNPQSFLFFIFHDRFLKWVFSPFPLQRWHVDKVLSRASLSVLWLMSATFKGVTSDGLITRGSFLKDWKCQVLTEKQSNATVFKGVSARADGGLFLFADALFWNWLASVHQSRNGDIKCPAPSPSFSWKACLYPFSL